MGLSLTSPFKNASDLLFPNDAEFSYGCAMVDLDRDGQMEILVLNINGPNFLYKWRGERLVDVAPDEFQDFQNSGIGLACADMTGNGFPDIYVMNTTAFLGPESDPDLLLVNEDGLKFHDLFAESRASNYGAGRSVAWLDFDGSGRFGAFVCNYAEPCRLFSLEKGRLMNIAPELGLNLVTGGRSVVAADFFNTGRMDLFLGNENDANKFYRNDGHRRFKEIAAEISLDDPTMHARGVAVCDFNRDGRPDIFMGNWEGHHRLFEQQPDGTFRDVAGRDLAMPSRVRTVIVFDYDNDGWEDIFINNMGEPNRLFHNNGDGTFSEVDAGDLRLPYGFGTGATVGDIDGDGFLDVFVSHGEMAPQENCLFLNTPNGNHWLRLHVQTAAGAPAIGARVIVYPEGDERPILRFIDGGSGYLCQMEQVAHIGLGQAMRAARVEVRLTTGQTWHGENIEADQNLVVRPDGDEWIIAPLELSD